MNRWFLLLLALASCKGPESEIPDVQFSSTRQPRAGLVISLNRVVMGKMTSISPRCVGQRFEITLPAPGRPGSVQPAGGLPIRPGDTAEFRNFLPEVPANVTSLSAPAVMFSPNLVKPYNFVREGTDEFSFWRFTFPLPGSYVFFDTNMGDPGRKVVDAYYGTVTYVGESDAPRGVVCVDEPGCLAAPECLTESPPAGCCQCIGVCCDSDSQCSAGKMCLRGRCVNSDSEEK
jgi:hypothetical protein